MNSKQLHRRRRRRRLLRCMTSFIISCAPKDAITSSGIAHLVTSTRASFCTTVTYLDISAVQSQGLVAQLAPMVGLVTLRANFGCISDLDLSLCLSSVSNIQNLDLSNCSELTDSCLEFLSSLASLRHLNIENCALITDVGLASISRLLTLEALHLCGLWQVTDVGATSLSVLASLHKLHVTCQQLTAAGVDVLAGSLLELTELKLDKISWRVKNRWLQCLALLPKLRTLTLSLSIITDYRIKSLPHLPRLAQLTFEDCDFLGGASFVGTLPELEELTLSGSSVIHAMESIGSNLHLLRHLDLSFTDVTDDGISQLGHGLLANLTSLILQGCASLTDAGLMMMANPPLHCNHNVENCCGFVQQLQLLNVSGCRNITNDGLQSIGRITTLERLYVSECSLIDDNGLSASLGSLIRLKELDLSYLHSITDKGLRVVAHIPCPLQSVTLRCCGQVTEVGIRYLRELHRGVRVSENFN